jgi:predicted metal-dependent HD superfamily phosphohydrolase
MSRGDNILYSKDDISGKFKDLAEMGIELTDANGLPYHNCSHIAWMTSTLELLFNRAVEDGFIIPGGATSTGAELELLGLLCVAAAWHDSHSTAGASNNEERSAELLDEQLLYRSDVTPWAGALLRKLILSTRYTIEPSTGVVNQLVVPREVRGSGELGMMPQTSERLEEIAELEHRLCELFADADLGMMALPSEDYHDNLLRLAEELGYVGTERFRELLEFELLYLRDQPLSTAVAEELYREPRRHNLEYVRELLG